MIDYGDGRDWTTRRLGSVTGWAGGDRLSVSWDPKSGPNVRVEGDARCGCDCDVDGPDDDGCCWVPQALVCNLTPAQAEELARCLRKAAKESRTFFGEPAGGGRGVSQ